MGVRWVKQVVLRLGEIGWGLVVDFGSSFGGFRGSQKVGINFYFVIEGGVVYSFIMKCISC